MNEQENSEKPEYKPDKKVEEVKLIRILAKDIPGPKKVYAGLCLIKGVSWGFANAICTALGIDREKRIENLSKDEIAKIEKFIEENQLSGFLMNRRKDLDSGSDKHLVGADLDLQKEFDIKRLRKIRSYKGSRHAMGLPVRGQRTRSNFRKNKKKSGLKGGKK